ncbi:hypothetical protein LCGC14_1763420 [marine sediment metagenome]|uniref:Uncharacterized protein n=1 Tax=marine sediment metagenome TaxID=412755 RepID=A0A0F9H0B2_9ZZZZ
MLTASHCFRFSAWLDQSLVSLPVVEVRASVLCRSTTALVGCSFQDAVSIIPKNLKGFSFAIYVTALLATPYLVSLCTLHQANRHRLRWSPGRGTRTPFG